MAAEIVTYTWLAATLHRRPPSCGGVRIVAVDGPSGAGKSTFARGLARAAGAPVVAADDFPVPWEADPLTWREPLRLAVLTPLCAGRPARFRRYDWRRDTYAAPVEIRPPRVLIVEGVGAAVAARPPAASPGAGPVYVIWVDAPGAIRRERVLRRDGAGTLASWQAWSAREELHFAAARTRERADLVIDGAAAAGSRAAGTFVRVR